MVLEKINILVKMCRVEYREKATNLILLRSVEVSFEMLSQWTPRETSVDYSLTCEH